MEQQKSYLAQLHYYKDLCLKEKSFYSEIKKLKESNTHSPGFNLLHEEDWQSDKTPFKTPN